MKSLRIYVLDPNLVSAIEMKSEKWKMSMDETVVKILKAGLEKEKSPTIKSSKITSKTSSGTEGNATS